MKVLRNHHNGNPTIFVNGLIINGCQTFTLSEAEDIFNKYNVSKQHRQDVYDNYVEKSIPEEILSFVNDEDKVLRKEVARQGCGLDILINDKNVDVRAIVAEQGYRLDILVNDSHWHVRTTVARQGYSLDVLINDKDANVRVAVARQGYGLNKLINDEDWYVRKAVARQNMLIKGKFRRLMETVAIVMKRFFYK